MFYREGQRIGGKGSGKIYYIIFKKDCKLFEEKAGRQYADAMTPARADGIRAERFEGKRLSRKEIRERTKAQKESKKLNIHRLYKEYKKQNPQIKGWKTYDSQYKLWIKPSFKYKEPESLVQLDIDRLRLKMLKERKPQTVKHALALLRRIINFGVKKQPCKGLSFSIQMPSVDNTRTEDLNTEQLKKLLKTIEKDKLPIAGAMMKMAFFTGFRHGEMFRFPGKPMQPRQNGRSHLARLFS